MSDTNKPQGFRTEVIVALIGLIGIISVAVIENWDTVIGQTPNSAPPSVSGVTTPSSSMPSTLTPPEPVSGEALSPQQPGAIAPSATTDSSAAASTLADCRITIRHPLVALMREPDRLGQQIIKVKPGEYTPLDHRMVSTMIHEEGWFQIEAEGRRGWIANDTWTIEEKTQTCP